MQSTSMIFRSVLLLLAMLLFMNSANGQDSLLLITGKKLDLKGAVVHYDDRFVYFQTDKQTSRMESESASVSWGEGNWHNFGQRIPRNRVAAILNANGANIVLNDVDRLLLSNGKIKWLKGKVVHYDYDLVLYQTDNQTALMKSALSKIDQKEEELKSDPKHIERQAKKVANDTRKRNQKRVKISRKREKLNEELEKRKNEFFTPDLEIWKNRVFGKLDSKEKQLVLDSLLRVQLESDRVANKRGKIQKKYTSRISRDLVFSILKSDSTEEVVYNADTLGYFADGEAEVDYGVTEMRAYIAGRQAGRKHNTNFDMILGIGVGTISAAVGSFWGPSIPAGTVIVTSIANVKIKNKAGIDESLLDNPAFRDGYDRSAKRKKAWNFIKGSVAGLSFGLLVGDGLFRNQLIPAPR